MNILKCLKLLVFHLKYLTDICASQNLTKEIKTGSEGDELAEQSGSQTLVFRLIRDLRLSKA